VERESEIVFSLCFIESRIGFQANFFKRKKKIKKTTSVHINNPNPGINRSIFLYFVLE
jgi:hypothetical protein